MFSMKRCHVPKRYLSISFFILTEIAKEISLSIYTSLIYTTINYDGKYNFNDITSVDKMKMKMCMGRQLLLSNIDGTTRAHCWRETLLCNGLISKLTPHSTGAKSCNYHGQKANYWFQT